MKISGTIQIHGRKLIDEMPGAWSQQDYKNILEETGLADGVTDAEVVEMTRMALSDEDPQQSAEIVLKYRLSEHLSDGQIQQLAHDMQEDKIPEEYPEIELQHELYNVNQFLYKAYNGKFPSCKAVEVELTLTLKNDAQPTAEIILRALAPALGGHSVIARLYEEQLNGELPFNDAEKIIWRSDIAAQGNGVFKIKTFSSEYWMHDLPMNSEEVAFDLVIAEAAEVEA